MYAIGANSSAPNQPNLYTIGIPSGKVTFLFPVAGIASNNHLSFKMGFNHAKQWLYLSAVTTSNKVSTPTIVKMDIVAKAVTMMPVIPATYFSSCLFSTIS